MPLGTAGRGILRIRLAIVEHNREISSEINILLKLIKSKSLYNKVILLSSKEILTASWTKSLGDCKSLKENITCNSTQAMRYELALSRK